MPSVTAVCAALVRLEELDSGWKQPLPAWAPSVPRRKLTVIHSFAPSSWPLITAALEASERKGDARKASETASMSTCCSRSEPQRHRF